MSLSTRIAYYARSLPTLLTGFRRPLQIAGIFLGVPGCLPAEVTLRSSGWRFRVREAMDVWILKETCLDGNYLAWGKPEPDWHIVDIGAGIGDFTIMVAKQCPAGTVHAYEPLASSTELLRHNLVLNQVDNVFVYREAASGKSESMTAMESDDPAVSTRFRATEQEGGVRSVTLAQVLDRLPGGRCDFMKVDCEGCEYEFLMSAELEALARVGRISLEIHRGPELVDPGELVRFLTASGFEVSVRPNPVHDWLGFVDAWREPRSQG